MTDVELEIEARIAKRLKEAAESLLVAEENRKHINRERAKMREEAYEFEMEKQTKMTIEQNTESEETEERLSYIVVREYEVSCGYEGYGEINVPEKDVLQLTAFEAEAMTDFLRTTNGSARTLVMIVPPKKFDLAKITADYTAKLNRIEEARLAREKKYTEAEKKKAEAKKLKQLARIKKELAALGVDSEKSLFSQSQT